MPAYNAEKFITQAVESILKQDYSDWELLILDDASTDSTSHIIHSYSDDRIRVFSNQVNLGYLKSCNQLFNLVQGDFVTFLDADDTCPPNRISACLCEFDEDSELGFLTTDHTRFNETEETVRNEPVDYDRYASDTGYAPMICCASAFVRGELLKKVGDYDPFFDRSGGEDYYWLYKLSRSGKGKHLGKPLYNYRQHSKQVHVLNNNTLKYFVSDILHEIREADKNGVSPLTNGEILSAHWIQFINENPALLALRKATEALNSKDSNAFWKNWLDAWMQKPHSTKKTRESIYLLYSFLARNT
jgi:glycosyltransferase involved in cell wall biosynthesis